MESIISITSATVRSLNKIIFTGLDFEVELNQHWAIIGNSGSGKTALLQTISGSLPILSGHVERNVSDEDILKANPFLTFHHFVAYVGARHHFKNLSNTTDLYYQQRYNSSDSEDVLTVQQYLQNIQPAHGSSTYWTYEKVVARLKLLPLLNEQLIKLSNGETKRLLIAAALLKNPKLLLLDQPLTGLDVKTRAEFDNILSEVALSGITIITATSPTEIPSVITHLALLNNCAIVKSGKKAEVNVSILQRLTPIQINADSIKNLYESESTASFEWLVKMNKVTVKYDDRTILHEIDWQIRPGECWALLGANGAGKSTLLSLINGDNPQAYANDIILFDRKRGTGESIWDIKRNIGFISPELYQYFPADTSCLHTILSGYYDTLGLFRKVNEKQSARAFEWMKVLDIHQHARQLLKNVPVSVQRLCLLARALIKNPPLLILDEPCQGMDSHLQQNFKAIIDTICHTSNVAVIYVTHYEHELPASVTKLLKLDNGKVV